MFSFISILFPAFISTYLEQKQLKIKEKIVLMFYYIIYCIIINSIVLFMVVISNNYEIVSITFTPLFTIKYILVSSFLAIVLPCIKKYITTNIDFKIIKKKRRKKL